MVNKTVVIGGKAVKSIFNFGHPYASFSFRFYKPSCIYHIFRIFNSPVRICKYWNLDLQIHFYYPLNSNNLISFVKVLDLLTYMSYSTYQYKISYLSFLIDTCFFVADAVLPFSVLISIWKTCIILILLGNQSYSCQRTIYFQIVFTFQKFNFVTFWPIINYFVTLN